MSVAIETAELIAALQAASKEAQDVIEATEDATDGDLAALGHNGVRDAAKDAHNICNNLVRRLGGLAIEPKKPEPVEQPIPEPEPEPEVSASEAMLDDLEAKKTNLDRAIEEAKAEEPPAEIADLMDSSLTTRQNLEALIAKFRDAKSLEEMARSNGDMNAAMEHLRDAQRYDSGIKWNRARLAEVI
jgi:hypothetical protein